MIARTIVIQSASRMASADSAGRVSHSLDVGTRRPLVPEEPAWDDLDFNLLVNPVPEDQDPGDTVGDFYNITEGATLSLADNADGWFSLSGTTLLVAAPLNYGVDPNPQITVRQTVGSFTYDNNFVIPLSPAE